MHVAVAEQEEGRHTLLTVTAKATNVSRMFMAGKEYWLNSNDSGTLASGN